MAVLRAPVEQRVQRVVLFVTGLAALPADHGVALRRQEARRTLRETERARLAQHAYAARLAFTRKQVAKRGIMVRQVPFDVQLASVGVLAVVDVRGLDAVEDVGVTQLLRVHGHDAQPGVIGFVGLQAEPGGLHEGFAVVGKLVAEGSAVGVERNLEACVGAGQDRQHGSEKEG